MKFSATMESLAKNILNKYGHHGLNLIGIVLLNILQNMKIKALFQKYLSILKKKPKNSKSILFFPSGFYQTLPSGKFRCYHVAKYLKNKGYFTLVISPKLGKKYRKKILEDLNPDWVWIQKAYHPYNRYKFFKKFKIIFDIDDPDFLNPYLSKPIHELFKNSQIITCGSELIKNYAKKFSNNIHKIWTPFPVEEEKKFKFQAKDRLIIGWTPSKADAYYESIKQLYKPLLNLHKKYNIIFRIDGGSTEKVRKLFSNLNWVQIIYSRPYKFFLKKLKEIDIGIHPLAKTPSNLAKSFGKTLNYMNAGIPCVATDIGENSKFFKDGINGFLAKTSEEWEIKLGKLIENQDLREKIANQAFQDMKKELSIENASRKYLKLLFN
ncbi:MAG: glycosyltransferase [Candidatus Helarchaeota archaeon]|nr:glycosyltransferase [Candidatus Helarchaeota archaeon]